MIEMKGHTTTRVDITTLGAGKSIETMSETIVFQVEIVTEGQARLNKTVDSGTKEVTTHLE